MQFINEAPLFKVIRIAGPKHNLLGLELCGEPVATPALEALDGTSERAGRLRADEILTQVTAGIGRAKAEFGRDFHVKRIQYVSSDTPSSDIYSDLALEILRRVEMS